MIAIIIEGGAIQNVISDDPTICHEIVVVDYDSEGDKEVPQDDGGTAPAYVTNFGMPRQAEPTEWWTAVAELAASDD